MSLYTYKLTYESGDAPNPYGGICSLAICKPTIRRTCNVGDWVAGIVSKGLVYRSKSTEDHFDELIYAMKISKKMSFKEYDEYCKKQCNIKLPENARTGDCIYFENDKGILEQRENYAHNLENKDTDLKGINKKDEDKAVILGEEFYYFGKNSIKIPKEMEEIIIKGEGHQRPKNQPYVEQFEEWIRTQKKGINGNPYMEMPKNIVKNKKGSCGSCKKIKIYKPNCGSKC